MLLLFAMIQAAAILEDLLALCMSCLLDRSFVHDSGARKLQPVTQHVWPA